MAQSFEVAQLYASFEERGLGKVNTGIGNLKSQLSGVTKILATVVSGFALKEMGKSFINAARQAEDYKTSIRAVSGSIKEADETFDRIRKWAAINPINTDAAVGAFVRLRTAAVQNAEQALEAVANAATVMHMDVRDVAGSIVTLETETLRRFGIILNRTGKEAKIQFGEVRKSVSNNIDAIRTGIIDVLNEAIPNAMKNAADTFSGILATMSGMWTEFQQKVMGVDTGPFGKLKDQLKELRDTWGNFMGTEEYDKLAESVSSLISTIITDGVAAVKALGNAFKWAYENAELVKTAMVAIVAYKGALLAMSIAQAALSTGVAAWISLAPAAITSMKAFVTWLGMAGSALGPVGWVALAVGAGYWLDLKKQMAEAEKEAKRVAEVTAKINEEFKNADANTLKRELQQVKRDLINVAKTAITAQQELLNLSTISIASGGGSFGLGGAVDALIDNTTTALNAQKTDLEARKKVLEDLLVVQEKIEGKAGGDKNKDDSSSKGKSAAEKLVENIRAQIKYLNADGSSFLGILDQWISKSKVLSKDWTALKDLQIDIKSAIEDSVISAAKARKETKEQAEDQEKALKSMKEAGESAWVSNLQWGKSQGLIDSTTLIDKLRERFEYFRTELGLTMEDYSKWPEYVRNIFSAFQSEAESNISKPLELLKGQYEQGVLSLGQYKAALSSLLTEWGNTPGVAATVQSALDALNKTILSFSDKMRGYYKDLSQAVEDLAYTSANQLVDGFARSIAYGEDLGDMFKSLAKDIAYTISKMMIMKTLFGESGSGGLLSGIFSLFSGGTSALVTSAAGTGLSSLHGTGLHSGGIVGRESTFSRFLPKFHTGGISSAEQLAVLKKKEGVFTEGQMKALGLMANAGTSQAEQRQQQPITLNVQSHIHAMDSQSFVAFAQKNRKVFDSLMVASISANSSVRKVIKEMA